MKSSPEQARSAAASLFTTLSTSANVKVEGRGIEGLDCPPARAAPTGSADFTGAGLASGAGSAPAASAGACSAAGSGGAGGGSMTSIRLSPDPRSLAISSHQGASLHAKCVVTDGRWTLLSSANFTEAAQERNIEAGVLLDDPTFAQRVTRQFDLLVEDETLQRLDVGVKE